MTFGGWRAVVEITLPIPCLLLGLLLFPTPRVFHRGVLIMVDQTLGIRAFGVIRLLHLMLLGTGLALYGTAKTTWELNKNKNPDWTQLTPNMQSNQLAKRWRAERNFWISLFCFTLWILLARIYVVLKHKAFAEDEAEKLALQERRRGLAPAAGASSSAPTVPAAPPPATSSKATKKAK